MKKKRPFVSVGVTNRDKMSSFVPVARPGTKGHPLLSRTGVPGWETGTTAVSNRDKSTFLQQCFFVSCEKTVENPLDLIHLYNLAPPMTFFRSNPNLCQPFFRVFQKSAASHSRLQLITYRSPQPCFIHSFQVLARFRSFSLRQFSLSVRFRLVVSVVPQFLL